MAYVSTNYKTNPKAPLGQWVCTRSSAEGPFEAEPPKDKTHGPDFCGQCVSFVTTVCSTIPVGTGAWKQGALVKGNAEIKAGTAIATFKDGVYRGHAAIYDSQDVTGITVYDQWVTAPANAIHKRVLRFGAHGNSNNGDNFYVVE
ncbi:BPSL0067 family protein [Zavarzinia sp.]|uniref:BPSL0067 family protein n=1 Tax=Zavarzinia sp. TaxID=2027920 RepID=UPI00356A60DA